MKKIYTAVVIGFTLITFYSCSSSRESIYDSDFPLTAETGKSISTGLNVRVPSGWFYVEENKNRSIDIWLVRDDFGAAITFIPIHIGEQSLFEIRNKEKNELTEALSYSKTIRRAALGKSFNQVMPDELFMMGEKPYAAYQFKKYNGNNVRVVVFKYSDYYFEVTAEFIKDTKAGAVDYNTLFKTQNSVIASLR